MLTVETPRPGDRIEVTTEAVRPQGGLHPGTRPTQRLGPSGTGTLATADRVRVVLAVHSERGIGLAIITRQAPTWPDELVIRWHLRGLESFDLSTARGRLSGSVSTASPDGALAGTATAESLAALPESAARVAAGLRSRLWRDGREESLLQSGDPWFAELRVCQPPRISPAETGRSAPVAEASAPPRASFSKEEPLAEATVAEAAVAETTVAEATGVDTAGAESVDSTMTGAVLPLQRGYFELTVPAALLAGQAPRLELAWIDFHR